VGHNLRISSGQHFGHHKAINMNVAADGQYVANPQSSYGDAGVVMGSIQIGNTIYQTLSTTGSARTNSMLRWMQGNPVPIPGFIIQYFRLPPWAKGFNEFTAAQNPSGPQYVIIPVWPGLFTPPPPPGMPVPPSQPPGQKPVGATPRPPKKPRVLRARKPRKFKAKHPGKEFYVQREVTHTGGLHHQTGRMHRVFAEQAVRYNMPSTQDLLATPYAPNPLTLYPLTADLWNSSVNSAPGPFTLIQSGLAIQLTGDFMNGTRQRISAAGVLGSGGTTIYQETDTTSTDLASQIASDLGLGIAGTFVNKQAKVGGTAGTSTLSFSFNLGNNPANSVGVIWESPPGDPNLASWPAGTVTVSLDVTLQNLNVAWQSLTFIRRVSSSSVSVVASVANLNMTLSAPGTYTQSLAVPASSGNASDQWGVVLGFSAQAQFHSQLVNIKSDLTITTPFGSSGISSISQVSPGHTHLAMTDPTIAIPDGYCGASYKETSQYSQASGGLNAPYFLAIPGGQSQNFWMVISQVDIQMPQVGRKKLLTLDRYGVPGNFQTLV
jgi:hypothetical protein